MPASRRAARRRRSAAWLRGGSARFRAAAAPRRPDWAPLLRADCQFQPSVRHRTVLAKLQLAGDGTLSPDTLGHLPECARAARPRSSLVQRMRRAAADCLRGLAAATTAPEGERNHQAQQLNFLQTYKALTDRGVPPQEAQADLGNPGRSNPPAARPDPWRPIGRSSGQPRRRPGSATTDLPAPQPILPREYPRVPTS